MKHGFYDLIDPALAIPEENRHWPDVHDPDAIDTLIAQMGGIDTVQGGVGCRGMVAFDEPPRSRYYKVTLEEYANSKTRMTQINDDTIVAYAQRVFGGCYDAIPPMGITIGMKSILTAKRGIFLVTTGAWKPDGHSRGAVQRADDRVSGDASDKLPAADDHLLRHAQRGPCALP